MHRGAPNARLHHDLTVASLSKPCLEEPIAEIRYLNFTGIFSELKWLCTSARPAAYGDDCGYPPNRASRDVNL